MSCRFRAVAQFHGVTVTDRSCRLAAVVIRVRGKGSNAVQNDGRSGVALQNRGEMLLKYMLQYSDTLNAAFSALADPTRRAMIARLCDGPASVGELAEPLPMSLSAVGQHLRLLEAAGLVVTEKRGRTRMCRVAPERLAAVETWFADRRRRTEHRLDRLEAFLQKDSES